MFKMKYFFRLRYISLIAVVSSFLGSLLMAFMGMEHTVRAAIYYFSPFLIEISHKHREGLSHNELTTLMIIEGIDAFLFSLVLIVLPMECITYLSEVKKLIADLTSLPG
jgi:hypothetical protein